MLCAACSRGEKQKAAAIEDRAATPDMEVKDISTLISDSGVVRYRINAKLWRMYENAQAQYWEFPEGVYLEKFNERLTVEASLVADYAYYDKRAERWQLRGHVHAMNEMGEEFETPELFWSQPNEKIYSDTTIRITKATSIIEGIGFESNQTMTLYTIQNPTGVFPIEE